MSALECSTDLRQSFMELAGKEFDDRIVHMNNVEEYLSTQKFKLGQVVEVMRTEYVDSKHYDVWKIGIVIRHGIPDGHGDYYRIHHNDKQNFDSADECLMRSLAEDKAIPDELKSYDVMWDVGDYKGKIMTIKTFK